MRIGNIKFNFYNDESKTSLHILNRKTNFCYFAIKITKNLKKSISWIYVNEKEIYSKSSGWMLK